MMYCQLFVLIDMRGQFVGAGIILAIGVVLLLCVSSKRGRSKSGTWIPIVALIAGPVIAVGSMTVALGLKTNSRYGATDVMISDYLATLPAVLLIGTFVGVVSAFVFAVAFRIRRPRGH